MMRRRLPTETARAGWDRLQTREVAVADRQILERADTGDEAHGRRHRGADRLRARQAERAEAAARLVRRPLQLEAPPLRLLASAASSTGNKERSSRCSVTPSTNRHFDALSTKRSAAAADLVGITDDYTQPDQAPHPPDHHSEGVNRPRPPADAVRPRRVHANDAMASPRAAHPALRDRPRMEGADRAPSPPSGGRDDARSLDQQRQGGDPFQHPLSRNQSPTIGATPQTRPDSRGWVADEAFRQGALVRCAGPCRVGDWARRRRLSDSGGVSSRTVRG